MKKIKVLTLLFAAAVFTVVATAVPVSARTSSNREECDHDNAYPVGSPSRGTCAPHTQRYHCDSCGWEGERDVQGDSNHEFNADGVCQKCGWYNERENKSGKAYKDPSDKGHEHWYDTFGVCTSCGYYCATYDVRNGWNGQYPATPSYYVPPVPVVPVLPVVPTSGATMSGVYGTFPLGVSFANARDTANQLAYANLTLTALGFKNLTPGVTFNLYAPNGYNATGVPQVVRIAAPATGLKAGDTAYVVYWNGIYHTTQLLPVVVDAFGNAAFAVPNMTATSIVTLVKCN